MPRPGRTVTRVFFVALFTVLVLESALQLAFPLLPMILIEQMPQYLERSGFRLQTEHGAREYPAGQLVDVEISQTSGDLYRLTCLAPADAPPFDNYRVEFRRDSHGFRNEEPWPDLVDLAIIGDSFTAAEAIAEPFWRDISESILVLGLPGSGTLEQQRLFQAFAVPRRPKIVVLSYFAGNDLTDNQVYAEVAQNGSSFLDRARQGKHVLDYSVLFNLALHIGNAITPKQSAPCHYPQMTEPEPPTYVAFYDEFLPLLALDEATMRASESFRLTSVGIGEMAAAQRLHGGDLILMYIPQKAELYWTALSRQSKEAIVSQIGAQLNNHGLAAIDANLAVQRNLMAELAKDLGIGFLDLSETLGNAITNGQEPYFFADTHWNQSGHNIARNALLDFFNRSNLDR